MDGYIVMSEKEAKYAEILQRIRDGKLSQKEGAERLSLTTRHVRRLSRRFEQGGLPGLVHGNRGRPSNRKVSDEERERIVSLIRERYADFRPTFAREKLQELNDIDRDPKTIRAIMVEAGLWKPKVRKKEKHRSWRERRACFGDMQQYDGSYEYWFEDRGPKCCLLASIDDATGIVTRAVFEGHEGVEPTFRFWQAYLETYGKPVSIYVDKFSTYSMNHETAKENSDTLTQFERAMKECGVELIRANSPQAKGRVERLFETLQDRLVKELRLAGISTPDEANRFLEERFLPLFNARFSVVPRERGDHHMKLRNREREALPSVFSRQCERVVKKDFTVIYDKAWYQLSEEQPVTVYTGDRVCVEERLDGSIRFRLRGKYLRSCQLPERPKRVERSVTALSPRAPYTPAKDHPWRKFDFSHSSKEIVRSGHF
jgi:transposase